VFSTESHAACCIDADADVHVAFVSYKGAADAADFYVLGKAPGIEN
jgi:hypothetical protein